MQFTFLIVKILSSKIAVVHLWTSRDGWPACELSVYISIIRSSWINLYMYGIGGTQDGCLVSSQAEKQQMCETCKARLLQVSRRHQLIWKDVSHVPTQSIWQSIWLCQPRCLFSMRDAFQCKPASQVNGLMSCGKSRTDRRRTAAGMKT